MKKCILLLLIIGTLSSCATRSDFHSFYKENKRDATFTISTPSFLANIFIPKEDTKDYEDLFRGVKHYKVMIYENNVESLDKKFDRFIARKKYSTIFKINENGEKVQIYYM